MEPNIDIGRKVRLAGMKTEELNGAIGTITDGPNLETGKQQRQWQRGPLEILDLKSSGTPQHSQPLGGL